MIKQKYCSVQKPDLATMKTVVVRALMMMILYLQNTTSNVARSASTLPPVSAVRLTTPTTSSSLSADDFTTSVKGEAAWAPVLPVRPTCLSPPFPHPVLPHL